MFFRATGGRTSRHMGWTGSSVSKKQPLTENPQEDFFFETGQLFQKKKDVDFGRDTVHLCGQKMIGLNLF